MRRVVRGLASSRVALAAVALGAILSAGVARADTVFQSVNATGTPGPFFWVPANIGWYWTPASDVDLLAIETKLTTGFSNINNNATFTTTLYTDRPAVGGTSLGSASWNGTAYNSDGWLGSDFSSPLSLTGGTTYFIGFTGWSQNLVHNGFNFVGGSGVNWVENGATPGFDLPPGAETLGIGSGYLGTGFDTVMNTTGLPNPVDAPILRFIAADPPVNPVPLPASSVLALTGIASMGFPAAWLRLRTARGRRRTTAA